MDPNNTPSDKYVEGYWKHDRYYGAWKRDKYLFPIDSEEMNRLDIFHKFFLVARHNDLFSYEIPQIRSRRPRILDLGTGTGIWAINVAEEQVENAEVLAVDINRIQPEFLPPNMKTLQFDIEEPSWTGLMTDCDLIHMRLMLGSIHNDAWKKVYRNALEHLTPGGYIEQVEIDWIPGWEGTDIPDQSALLHWAEQFLQGMDGFQRSVRISTRGARQMMESVGFTDFKEQRIRCYVNPWSDNDYEKDVAQWFNLGFIDGLEAMSLVPLVEKLGRTREEVTALAERVKIECCKLRYHAYCTIHIWTARRPLRS